MKTTLVFKFTAGSVDDQYMTMKVLTDGQQFDQTVADSFEVNLDVEIPTQIKFQLDNKLPSDTIVENGSIVADKFIKLESVVIDGFEVEAWRIPENSLWLESTETHHTNYWGFNGTGKFTINYPDPALWLLNCPKLIN